MDLDRLLGIEAESAFDRQAQELAESDARLVRDLVELRRTKGLTQTDVAGIMGVSQGAVARIEKAGRDPRLSTLRRYSMAVGAMISHTVTSASTGADGDGSVRAETSSTDNEEVFRQFFVGTSGVYSEVMTIVTEPCETLMPLGGPCRLTASPGLHAWMSLDADTDWVQVTQEASEAEEPTEAATR